MVKVEYKIPTAPKALIIKLVATAEERIFTRLLPNKIALIANSFFFSSFWVLIDFWSFSSTFFCKRSSEILVSAVSDEEKKADSIISMTIIII